MIRAEISIAPLLITDRRFQRDRQLGDAQVIMGWFDGFCWASNWIWRVPKALKWTAKRTSQTGLWICSQSFSSTKLTSFYNILHLYLIASKIASSTFTCSYYFICCYESFFSTISDHLCFLFTQIQHWIKGNKFHSFCVHFCSSAQDSRELRLNFSLDIAKAIEMIRLLTEIQSSSVLYVHRQTNLSEKTWKYIQVISHHSSCIKHDEWCILSWPARSSTRATLSNDAIYKIWISNDNQFVWN